MTFPMQKLFALLTAVFVASADAGCMIAPDSNGHVYIDQPIPHWAFNLCSALQSVTLGNGVTAIGDNAFLSTGVTSIDIPDSVTWIGQEAFRDCDVLQSVTLGNGVTAIGVYAFLSTGVTSIDIPDSVTSIGQAAFLACSALQSVTLGNGVTAIGIEAFRECSALQSVTIPAGTALPTLGVNAFQNAGVSSITYRTAEGPSTNPGSTLTGDPHLQFAHGGSADFRGKNNTNYALLSAPGMQVSGKTVEADFILPHPQLVHGSFFVHADWMVRGTSGRVYAIASDANEIGFTVSEVTTEGLAFIKKLGGANKQWQWAADGIFAMYHGYAPLSVRANGWEVNATRRPIYNHVAGPSRWRFDLAVRPLDGTTGLETDYGTASTTCFPHGIIGQSWDGDDIAVSGAADDYTFGAAGIFKFEMTTKAMAEGAIEGVASDYEVLPHDSGFKFSRFEESPKSVCAPRNVAKLTGKHFPRARVATAGSDDSVHEADAISAL